MTDPDPTHPQQPHCLPCRKGRHLACQWRTRPTSCACSCPWLRADMLEHFPSLRRLWLEENP